MKYAIIIAAALIAAVLILIILLRKRGNKAAVRGLTVTAHSGCMGLPDNSLEAMEAGIKAGASIVEFDLNFTDDGVPVLSHNKPESKKEYVTLREAFEFLGVHPGIKANVDVKNTSRLECIAPLAREAGVFDRIFYTGITEAFLPDVKQKSPEIPYYLNTSVGLIGGIKKAADKVESSGAIGINLNYAHMSSALSREMHRRGLLVSVWTVNTPGKAKFILRKSPDNITSRNPDIIVSLVKNAR